MDVLVETSAQDLSKGELITTREADGLSWVLLTIESLQGGDYFMACLCAERFKHQGRKKSHYYEWLSFRCPGKTFTERAQALEYIASKS